MRVVPFVLLVLCVPVTAFAGQPITSFAPDTTARHVHARADTVDRPVWLGIQYAPAVGDAGDAGSAVTLAAARRRAWEAEGTPWIGFGAAWPWAMPVESWLAGGYEHWKYTSQPETIPFAPGLLGSLDPGIVDEYVLRGGFDFIIGRDHAANVAVGPGLGAGLAYTRVEPYARNDWSMIGELLVRGVARARLGNATRLSAGATTGLSFDFRTQSDPLWHWELEFRIERSVGGGAGARH